MTDEIKDYRELNVRIKRNLEWITGSSFMLGDIGRARFYSQREINLTVYNRLSDYLDKISDYINLDKRRRSFYEKN